MARHGAPHPDANDQRHTLSISDVEAELVTAGVPRSRRQVIRYAESGMLDGVKVPGPSGDQWYIAPASVPKVIGDLKQWEAQRANAEVRQAVTDPDTAGHGTPRHAMSDEQISQDESATQSDMAGHDTPRPTASDHHGPNSSLEADADAAGHGTPRQAMSDQRTLEGSTTHPDAARHGLTELDIFEHPYVKRLESQVEKLEGKLDAQVRRTEEIQLKSQQNLMELQRMIAVGQSETLANFMLKAREWVLGKSGEVAQESGEAQPSA